MLLEQIPSEAWKKFYVIVARDRDQFASEHISGALKVECKAKGGFEAAARAAAAVVPTR